MNLLDKLRATGIMAYLILEFNPLNDNVQYMVEQYDNPKPIYEENIQTANILGEDINSIAMAVAGATAIFITSYLKKKNKK
jgi:hypothetical protein